MTMLKKKAVLECDCCTQTCPGCCMPVDEDGNAVDIPFEIVAPGCAIDGMTGVFNPLAIAPVSGPCGICGTWGYSGTIDIPGKFWQFTGIPGMCDLIPVCNQLLCLLLTCDAEQGITDDPGNDNCCRRMRLYHACFYEFLGSSDNGDTGACGPGFRYEKWAAPDTCSCGEPLSAQFSLNIDPLYYEDPECGLIQPCVPDCDISDIKVVI